MNIKQLEEMLQYKIAKYEQVKEEYEERKEN